MVYIDVNYQTLEDASRNLLEQICRHIGFTPEQDDTDNDLRCVIRSNTEGKQQITKPTWWR